MCAFAACIILFQNMRLGHLAICASAVLFFLVEGVHGLSGAEDAAPAQSRTEELSAKLKTMPPAEREALLKQIREKYNRPRPGRELLEKRRQELKNLSQPERQAKLREWRAIAGSNAPVALPLTTEERLAQRKELRGRLQGQMDHVRTNQDLKLTPEDRKRLFERMQEVAKNFDRNRGVSRPQPGSPTEEQKAPAEQ